MTVAVVIITIIVIIIIIIIIMMMMMMMMMMTIIIIVYITGIKEFKIYSVQCLPKGYLNCEPIIRKIKSV